MVQGGQSLKAPWANGRFTLSEKLLPRPGSLTTLISPSIMSASQPQIGRPRPAPPSLVASIT
ncbi:hypothetical protein D3C80_2167220 [compost metagenome]